MLRAIVLSLALLIGLGTIIPLATEMAEAGPRHERKYQKKKRKGAKRYSKRWWRLRKKSVRKRRAQTKLRRSRKLRRARSARKRRLVRKRRVRLARKRRLAKKRRVRRTRKRRYTKRRRSTTAKRRSTKRRYTKRKRSTTAKRRSTKRRYTKRRRSTVARKRRTIKRRSTKRSYTRKVSSKATPRYSAPAVTPQTKVASKDWMNNGSNNGQVQFDVKDQRSGSQLGAASISIVGQAIENNRIINNRVKTVGGVSTTALRRTVIDEMIREEGWVVNDYQKEVNGKKVYVVVAQAPDANNQVENRMFYFTETDGKIYRVATKAPEKNSEKLAEESEKVIDSLSPRKPVQPQIASNRAVIKDDEDE